MSFWLKKWYRKLKQKYSGISKRIVIYLSTDVYVIEHPKCGRTWIRSILDSYMEMVNINIRIRYTHNGSEFNMLDSKAIERKKVLSRLKFRYKKIVFLIREPKDVMVSLYFQATKRMGVFEDGSSISDFIRHPCFGIEKMIAFLNIWDFLFKRGIVKDYIIISYESMHKNCFEQMERMFRFLDIKIDEDKLRKVIDKNTFERLQKKEIENTINSEGKRYGYLKAKDLNDPESFKLRKGAIRGYKMYLNDEDIAYINGKVNSDLKANVEGFRYLKQL